MEDISYKHKELAQLEAAVAAGETPFPTVGDRIRVLRQELEPAPVVPVTPVETAPVEPVAPVEAVPTPATPAEPVQ